jgi:hypothetical protein
MSSQDIIGEETPLIERWVSAKISLPCDTRGCPYATMSATVRRLF